MRALIGDTGFVGSNLRYEGQYDCLFRSSNSKDMIGQHFSEVVCAGVSAVKWKANKDPDEDWNGIRRLADNLATIKADRFILISTVDVYQDPVGVTERTPPDTTGTAYGVHRARLERFVSETFPGKTIILRLPALYGRHLKKNALYDLQNDNMVGNINPAARFQWYDTRRLERDLKLAIASGVPVLNITAEPVAMAEIGERFFPDKLKRPQLDRPAPLYDVRTLYPEILGGGGSYHFTAAQVFEGIGNFLDEGK